MILTSSAGYAMTPYIVLDELSLPETGTVRLKLDRIFTINISATEARRKVSNWLAWEVTMTLMGQEPSLVIGEPVVWRVPVVFTAGHVGVVGGVGAIDVEVESGEILRPEGIEEAMLCEAKKLAKDLPPYQPRKIPDELLFRGELPSPTPRRSDPQAIIAAARQS